MLQALLLSALVLSGTPKEAPAPEEAVVRPSIKVTLTRTDPCPTPEEKEEAGEQNVCESRFSVFDGIPEPGLVLDLNEGAGKTAGFPPFASVVNLDVTVSSPYLVRVESIIEFIPTWGHGTWSLEGRFVKSVAGPDSTKADKIEYELPMLGIYSDTISNPQISMTQAEADSFIKETNQIYGLIGLCTAASNVSEPDGPLTPKEMRSIFERPPDHPLEANVKKAFEDKCIGRLREGLITESAGWLYDVRKVQIIIKGRSSPDSPEIELLRLHYNVYHEC